MPKESSTVLSTIATAILVTCAVTLTTIAVKRELKPPAIVSAQNRVERQDNWRDFVTGGNRIGSADAKVTITEFGDFQCPACRQLSKVLKDVMATRTGDAALLFRHSPLPSHPFAQAAAVASVCAARQGRFEAMHDSLFASQARLGERPWLDLAVSAGVQDTASFKKCLSDSTAIAAINVDRSAAERLKVIGTPTVLINSARFVGVPSRQLLDSLVDTAIADSRKQALHTRP